MPTATNILGLEPHNLGPLTTPAVLPTTCADKRYTYIATTLDEGRTGILGLPECYTSIRTECFPSGDGYQEKADKATRYWLDYYSPGYECPSGWKTVGVMEKGGKSEGIFTKDLDLPDVGDKDNAVFLPAMAQYSALLGESETAVWCCPSDMEADIDGQCYSSIGKLGDFPSVTASCVNRVDSNDDPWATVNSLAGSSYTTPLLSYRPNTAATTVHETETIDKKLLPSDVFLIQAQGVVALIHKKGDNKGDNGGKDGDKDAKDGGKDGDKKSAASTVGPTVFGAVSYVPVVAALTSVLASMILL